MLTFVALGGEGKTSLVAKWAAQLAGQGWPECEGCFAWSFYSQGVHEQSAASDLFFQSALTFFGDADDRAFATSSADAHEKGLRLARIVGRRRCLLVLDGLEPLQYAPGTPTAGDLKDKGVSALLRGLAADSRGLCVVTTRYSLPDLKAFWPTVAREEKLHRLSRTAGVHLLKTLGVRGSDRRTIPSADGREQLSEFEALVEEVRGHALTLILLGSFLARAFGGDIRRRDRVRFEKADSQIDGGHAFRTMAAYEQWLLSDGGAEGQREVAVLRLMGLFDRPADAGCLAALRRELIADLTDLLAELAEEDWEFCLSGLETAKLLTVNRDATGTLVSLDAHPHLREYFAKHLREGKPGAWRAGHRRLFDYLCATTREGNSPTLDALQPLFQAVAHGCHAGVPQQARDTVYIARILRGEEFYSTSKLGAIASELGAVACFFETPWTRVSPNLTEDSQAWLLNAAAYHLRALGRLTEALEPMRAGLQMRVRQENWKNAAISSNNLSELRLLLGDVPGAVGDAKHAVALADRSGDAFQRVARRTTQAGALHQSGRRDEAHALFREAERMQAERMQAEWMQAEYPRLSSLQGFRYCDLLLAEPERAAWRLGAGAEGTEDVRAACREVAEWANQALRIAERNNWLLDIALDHLTLGRAALFEALLGGSDFRAARAELGTAVVGLRHAGTTHHLPRGLLARAWLRAVDGPRTGPDSAVSDLDEAWEIAERGPMPLFLADIHLHRTRLFFGEVPYPWDSPTADLAAAEALIAKHGYHRRDEEFANAKRLILGSGPPKTLPGKGELPAIGPTSTAKKPRAGRKKPGPRRKKPGTGTE